MSNKTIYTFLFFLLSLYTISAQITKPAFADLSTDSITWKDASGEHLLLLSHSGEVKGNEEDTRSSYIKAIHLLKNKKEYQKLWELWDGEEDCVLDVEAQFIAAPRFTDFNKDGLQEVWIIYQTACKGDISPSTIIVKMIDEEKREFILRGEQLIELPGEEPYGGTYTFDPYIIKKEEVYKNFAIDFFKEFYKVTYTN